MCKGVFQQAPTAGPGVNAGGHCQRVRIVVDLYIKFVANVEPFQILTHTDQIDVFETATGNQRTRRAQIGIQLELFTQAYVGAPVAPARGSLKWTFESQLRLANALQCCRRQRIIRGLHACKPGQLAIPLNGRAQGTERSQGSLDYLWTDSVSGN